MRDGTARTIRFNAPAANWNEAIPLGNGRLGGMVFGTIQAEHIQLNEESLWYGGFRDRNNPDAATYLEEIRTFIRQGRIAEAERLSVMALSGIPESQRHYESLGDLFLFFDQSNTEDAEGYERILDIETATATVRFSQNGIRYTRTYLVSAVDQCLVVRLEADAGTALSFRAVLRRGRYLEKTEKESNDSLILRGYSGGEGGTRFCTRVRVVADGGCVRTVGETIDVREVNSVTLFLSASTSYRTNAYKQECADWVRKASRRPWPDILKDHVFDYREYYGRVAFSLSDGSEPKDELCTAERLARMRSGERDLDLIATYFQFGRYLLICSSRPGCLPATLQGIWNKDWNPPWDSTYTINIRTQMNYWPAESCNLSELHEPLFDLIERMRPNGRHTARIMYDCRGFTAHHSTDIWGDTAPQDVRLPASFWPMGAAWLCLHFWYRYEMTMDLDFLAEKYETMKEAALFFLDYLESDGKDRLVASPSVSPENSYILPNGERGALCRGAAMDSQIIRELLENCANASEILNIDEATREVFRATATKLPKHEIGKHGQIMEWAEDFDEVEMDHRHMSNLFALHPGHEITVRGTPELAKAARKTLERRLAYGGGLTGWSRAWIINLWARLEDGDLAGKNVTALLVDSTLPNLLGSHPPSQIDGNFGGTAGIAEMLIQSHAGEIHLLPALPSAWKNGKIEGMRARGAYGVDIEWKDGTLASATIRADKGGRPIIRYGKITAEYSLRSKEQVRLDKDLKPRV